jgi:hypothetical protein
MSKDEQWWSIADSRTHSFVPYMTLVCTPGIRPLMYTSGAWLIRSSEVAIIVVLETGSPSASYMGFEQYILLRRATQETRFTQIVTFLPRFIHACRCHRRLLVTLTSIPAYSC